MSGIQAMLLSSSGLVPGNSGILTSASSSYTLPTSCGYKIKVLAIGAGGGGGGGSGRTSFSGYFTGGGGGGAGGNAYAEVSVIPGQTVSFSIANFAGSAGVARDGIYSSGSNGGSGLATEVIVSGATVALATGGSGGLVAPNATGGAAGSASTGTALLSATTGGTAPTGTTYGGTGAAGYNINTTVGATTILTYGSSGVTYPEGVTNTYNTAGTGYGAGGSGGSCAQSDVYVPSYNIGGVAGVEGVVFIWWGY